MKRRIADYIICLLAVLSVPSAVWGASGPVRQLGADYPTQGLTGRNIALWQSHGHYYNLDKDSWLWQRAHLMQTIEDFYTSSYVLELLVPMLENAGAYVMLPRERDLNPIEVIIDADSRLTPGFKSDGWEDAGVTGFKMPDSTLTDRENPFAAGSVMKIAATADPSRESLAEYRAVMPAAGLYNIYVSYATLPQSASEVVYTVNSLRGQERFAVNQTMGGGTWIRLGEFPLAAGEQPLPVVAVSNLVEGDASGKVVTADAVRIGGGMGSVARGNKSAPTVSGKPRWAEGARYWLQWAGVPDSVYSPTEYKNDYSDDFGSRPRWVNYLAGGSARLPKEKGLRIPIDVVLALHTDAGITPDSSIVGTLGIYSTNGGKRLGDGGRRTTNKVLAEKVVGQIVDDIRAQYDPNWTRRKLRDRKYAEARIPMVPAVLIELLSHQNYADMRYGHDPQFRFDVSRSIYKGILRYLNDGKAVTVQPLPVGSFGIESRGDGRYRLSWLPVDDPLEPSAAPESYVIERRERGGVFKPLATTTSTTYDYKAVPGGVASFRVIAVNDGGRSFPSETLALGWFDNGNPEWLIVNGFDRVSGPAGFDDGDSAGFLDAIDYGVPYVRNIAYAGSQYDFSRASEWKDDVITPGFGASDSSYDARPVAGNTFDYPVMHGEMLARLRVPFTSASASAYIAAPECYSQRVVDLILGKQRETESLHVGESTRFKAIPADLQARLSRHVGDGGTLLVSGEYAAGDLFENSYSDPETKYADMEFAFATLGVDRTQEVGEVSDEVNILPHWTNGHRGDVARFNSKPNDDFYPVSHPDALVASERGRADVLMTYGADHQAAAIATYDGRSVVITVGFPIEAITDDADREAVMAQFANYLWPEKRNIAPRVVQLRAPDPMTVVEAPSTSPNDEIEIVVINSVITPQTDN